MFRHKKITGVVFIVLLVALLIPLLGLTGACTGIDGPIEDDPVTIVGDPGIEGDKGDPGEKGDKGDPGLVIDDPEEVANVLKSDAEFQDSVRGETGAQGLSCWDLDGDNICDLADDANEDGECNALDCQGTDGDGDGGGDITAVIAESGLTGGGTFGDVSLRIDTSDASSGQTLMYDGTSVVWDTPPGGGPPSGPAGGDLTGNYPNPEIADGAVTLNAISSSGASAGDVITYTGSNVAWNPPGGTTGPKVEFAEDEELDTIVLTTSWQTILQVTIDVSQSGKVHAIGNTSVRLGSDAENKALLGISLTPGGAPINIAARVDYADSHPDGSVTLSATTQYVGSVGPGSHTFYLVAERVTNTGGTISVNRYQLSVMFLPD